MKYKIGDRVRVVVPGHFVHLDESYEIVRTMGTSVRLDLGTIKWWFPINEVRPAGIEVL